MQAETTTTWHKGRISRDRYNGSGRQSVGDGRRNSAGLTSRVCHKWINVTDWEFDRINREVNRLRNEGWVLEDAVSPDTNGMGDEAQELSLRFVRQCCDASSC